MVFFGGIHGNEKSGVIALSKVHEILVQKNIPLVGNIYAINGNLKALEKNQRFIDVDLNRIWTEEYMQSSAKRQEYDWSEFDELSSILEVLQKILQEESGPFYFFDLHTTSGETIPFLTVNDSLLNRKFTSQYPVPVVLGIEEFLEGPLLSYINELGYVSFGFEAGQHDDPVAIANQEAFIMLSLVFCEALDAQEIDFDHFKSRLQKSTQSVDDLFEIFYRRVVRPTDTFEMLPGFKNFEQIRKGTPLAIHNGKEIYSTKNGRIFMPRYQPQGDDGYFGIRRIAPFFLKFSAVLRLIRIDALLVFLPGIRFLPGKEEILIVNLRIARFFTNSFFHLLGYRSKHLDQNTLVMKNREAKSRNDDYKNMKWY